MHTENFFHKKSSVTLKLFFTKGPARSICEGVAVWFSFRVGGVNFRCGDGARAQRNSFVEFSKRRSPSDCSS